MLGPGQTGVGTLTGLPKASFLSSGASDFSQSLVPSDVQQAAPTFSVTIDEVNDVVSSDGNLWRQNATQASSPPQSVDSHLSSAGRPMCAAGLQAAVHDALSGKVLGEQKKYPRVLVQLAGSAVCVTV